METILFCLNRLSYEQIVSGCTQLGIEDDMKCNSLQLGYVGILKKLASNTNICVKQKTKHLGLDTLAQKRILIPTESVDFNG